MREEPIRQPMLGPANLGAIRLTGVYSQSYPADYGFEHGYAHSKDLMLLLISAEGGIRLTVDREGERLDLELPKGKCVLLRETDLRSLMPTEYWTPHWYDFLYESSASLPLLRVFQAPPSERLRQCFETILARIREDNLWGRRHATAVFAGLLAEVLATNPFDEVGDDYAHAVHRVTEHLSANLSRVVSLEEMADVAGLSLSSFRLRFKQTMGMTYKTYYDNLRIESARGLLFAGASVKEVAEKLGYSDPFHFSRAFRRICGKTPSEVARFHREQTAP
ncbi:MAG: AraC family transcriptional regulator [Planctomycetota bacterium]